VFVDLFEADGGRLEHAVSGAPRASHESGALNRRLEIEAQGPASYVLRMQPELLATGRYELDIDTEPLLAFPVDGYDTRAIQSVFGAERDGGRRAHRGVDIFATRGTPALASVDGWVARVDTTPRGGNVVWLQPLFGDMRLYYAHLDTQLVETGQFVSAGDVVGTVGNTGNAITTPPHLHFGVYLRRQGRRGGARDPYFFLN
jgi:murein DD-endopeptidase MepM/ murein hydrolase activator NlpD